MAGIGEFFSSVAASFGVAAQDGGDFLSYVVMASRYILPAIALMVLFRCVRSMLQEKYEPEIWAYFGMPDGSRVPLRHWECTVGRAAMSDIVLDYTTVSRSHAAIIRDDRSKWRVHDLAQGGTLAVNGEDVVGSAEIRDGDTLSLGGIKLRFISLTESERLSLGEVRTRPGGLVRPGVTLFELTVFQTVLALVHAINARPEHVFPISLSFFALIAAQWAYYLSMRALRRTGIELETLAFFLTTLGFSVAATSVPEDMAKQVILFIAALGGFLLLGWWLRDLRRASKLRWPMGALALGLLAVNLVLATETFGARNWIEIGGVRFQPSEFVKIAYIYTGTAALQRLYMGRNLFLYIAFSAVCVGALALMGDFGAALIFFATFLIISYMRSGNLATVFLAVSGAGLAGFLVLSIRPHVAQRFASWGHIWEQVNDAGYQQTRALAASASGGLFGKGAGSGWLHNIVAADTDMVFCVISEELGLLVAFLAVAAIIAIAFFALRNASAGRSSFYVIAAIASASMLMIQLALNVFGSLDILPFTGVTFPFVSRGGSSLISCWTLMAFIKATDTRQNASFAIKLPSLRRARREEMEMLGADGGDLEDDE